MSINKKYSFQVSEDETDGSWRAEITRRATAKRTVVSKKQDGFATRAEAQAWAETALAEFLALNERNKKQSRRS